MPLRTKYHSVKSLPVGDDAYIVPKETGGNVPLKRKFPQNPTFRADVGIGTYGWNLYFVTLDS